MTATTSPTNTGPLVPRGTPAGKVLGTMMICLLTWMVLASPALLQASEAGPLGARRSVSLFFLRPLDGLAHVLGLDRIEEALTAATGQGTAGHVGIAPVPVTAGGPRAQPGQPLREPSRKNPLRIVVVGDSLAEEVGWGLQQALNQDLVQVQVRGVAATGLSRPDYFDWPTNLRTIVDRFKPDVVVVMFGGNDAQSMTRPGQSPVFWSQRDRWTREYANRVRDFTKIITDTGARVAWVGLPPVRDPGLDQALQSLDAIYQGAVTSRPGGLFVPLRPRFSGENGGYSAYLPDSRGRDQLVRQPDGVHFTTLGETWAADEVLGAMQDAWGLQGAVKG